MQYQFEKNGSLKTLTPEDLEAADRRTSIIVCSYGTGADGNEYWVYMAVKPSKYAELLCSTEEQQYIEFGHYGTILRYGIGEEVPASVKEEIKQEYGWDDDCIPRLKNDIRQQQAVFLKKQEDERISDIVARMKKQE